MTFSLIHPSIRPNKWREIYEAWIAAAEHPENVEYILVVDEKWGFRKDAFSEWHQINDFLFLGERGDDDNNVLLWQNGSYVAAVNYGAKDARGDVMIVIADDIWPAKGWDTVIESQIVTTEIIGEFAIWVNNGGSPERRAAARDTIMEMPVVSRSRVGRLGYLYYPSYLSMYADNDLAEHCMLDAKEGRCSLIRLEEPVFPHLHPVSDRSIPVDAQYAHQNRPAAYALGKQILDARRRANFGDVLLSESGKKRIAICVAGGPFPVAWLARWTELLELGQEYDIDLVFNFTNTDVYRMRIDMSRNVLNLEPCNYVLWLDDDQLVTLDQVKQLIADLDEHPDIDMVAGWTVTGTDVYETEATLSFGDFDDGKFIAAKPSDVGPPHPQVCEVDYTGFPLVLMRSGLLSDMTPEAFAPLPIKHSAFGFCGEDISFCLRARAARKKICVDRRVGPLPHLKLRDIAAGVKI